MLQGINRNINRILFFTVSSLTAIILICLMKQLDEKNYSLVTDEETEFLPVNQKISELQKSIAIERENRLRQLNNSPKEIKQEALTTTITTTTTDPNVNTSVAPKPVEVAPQATTKKTTVTKPKADKKTKTS